MFIVLLRLRYVSGYGLSFNHPLTEENLPLFKDIPGDKTMFRVVVKANINDDMISHLACAIEDSMSYLDKMSDMYISSHHLRNQKALMQAAHVIPFAVSDDFMSHPKQKEAGDDGFDKPRPDSLLTGLEASTASLVFKGVAALKSTLKDKVLHGNVKTTC